MHQRLASKASRCSTCQRLIDLYINLALKELSSIQAGDAQTSTGGSTKPSDAGSGIVANLADLTKLGASAT